ncbi:hypothetical protein BC827DRAFT_368369 [Russula dissimulans]|nr:hypothetical protein BC827DRAFT_368369 [Russula dissimulans]
MNEFTEDHSNRLLSKEWLIKIDNEKSVPYLMKLHTTFADQTCVFLITDTKTVWAEVLSRQQLCRRWSALNPNSAPSDPIYLEEDHWVDQALQYLVDAHAPSIMGELSFDVSESRYSDLAADLSGDSFKWRWETFSIGPKQSAAVLSKHLTLPLLSTACMALMFPAAISEISGSDLEKAVDRVGRTARRSVDTHIRNIFSHPRACTTIRRFSALFAFSDNLPAVLDEFEHPELTIPSAVDSAAGSERIPNKTPALRVPSISLDRTQSPNPRQVKIGPGDAPPTKAIATRQGPGTGVLDHATPGHPPPTPTEATGGEDDDDDDGILVPSRKQQLRKERASSRSTTTAAAASQSKSASLTSSSPAPSVPGSYAHAHTSLARRSGGGPSHAPLSDSDDSPQRLSKREREEAQDRDSDDSDDGSKRGQMRWRGTKQPIKRVGRRF